MSDFSHLTHAVEYMGNPDRRVWPAPHHWQVMAAFDCVGAAEFYLKGCQREPKIDADTGFDTNPWVYRCVELPQRKDD